MKKITVSIYWQVYQKSDMRMTSIIKVIDPGFILHGSAWNKEPTLQWITVKGHFGLDYDYIYAKQTE